MSGGRLCHTKKFNHLPISKKDNEMIMTLLIVTYNFIIPVLQDVVLIYMVSSNSLYSKVRIGNRPVS